MLRSITHCILLGILLLTASSLVSATDLKIASLTAPNPSALIGVAVPIVFVVQNQNVLTAEAYTINVSVTNSTNQQVFSEVVTGKVIQPFTTLEHTTSLQWTPSSLGTYSIRLKINFAQDIDTTNNVSVFSVAVIPAQYQLQPFSVQYNKSDTAHGQDCLIAFTALASNVWKYLNLGYPVAGTVAWVLKNMPLPPKDEYYTYKTLISLPIIGSGPTTIPLVTYVTTSPLTTMSEDSTTAIVYDFPKDTIDIGDKGMLDSTTIAFLYNPPPLTPATAAPVTEAAIRSCDVPNIDLDSSTYNPTSVPGYAGDKNACAPTACANSMQWLEKHFPINTGLSHREKLVELSKLMGRANNTGVWSEDFIRAKLAYINKYNLPIKVKFQVRGLTKDIESPPEDDYESKASNQIEGAYPKWEWVKQEMHDSEDVEMFLEYHDRSGDSTRVVGRHVITASGVAESAGQHRFWYKDDGNQSRAGGTSETANEWRLRGGTVPIIDHVDYSATQSRTTVVYGAVSESYDSTVKRKEKSYWKKFKDRQLGWSPRYEHGNPVDWVKSHTLRFGNMYTRLRNGVYQDNEWRWVLRNFPIGDVFGGGTSTITNHFTLGIDTTRFPDPMEVRVIYSDAPVKTMPQNVGPGILYPIPDSPGDYANSSPNIGNEPPPTTHNSVVFPEVDGKPYKVDTAIVYTDVPGEHISAESSGMVGQSFYIYAAAALSWLGAHVPEMHLPLANSDLRVCFIQAYNQIISGEPVNVNSALRALISCPAWGVNTFIPFDIRYQSFRVKDTLVGPTQPQVSPVMAINESVNGRITWEWLRDRLRRFGPMPIEIGYYNDEGRTHGTSALIVGLVEHNGLRRLIMNVDMEEDRIGGQEKLVHTIQEDNGYLYLVEQSSDVQRAYIETALSFEYDPHTLDVKDQSPIDIYAVTLAPQPADDVLTLSWRQALTSNAVVSVVDMLGVEHIHADVSTDGVTNWTTSTTHLPNGRYTIVLRTNAGRTTLPLVVLHD